MEITNQREIYIYISIYGFNGKFMEIPRDCIYICVDTGVYKWDKNL